MTNLRFPITLTLKIAEEEHELDVYIWKSRQNLHKVQNESMSREDQTSMTK